MNRHCLSCISAHVYSALWPLIALFLRITYFTQFFQTSQKTIENFIQYMRCSRLDVSEIRSYMAKMGRSHFDRFSSEDIVSCNVGKEVTPSGFERGSFRDIGISVKYVEKNRGHAINLCNPGTSCSLFVLLLLVLVPATQAAWWFVSQIESSSEKVHCGNIPGLVRRQRLLCERNPDLMVALAEGAALGIQECQFQFKSSKWNCSTFSRDTSVFGQQHTLKSTREASFIQAINSAAVVHTVTRACNEGALPHCACDSSKQGVHRDHRGEFTWGGCSDNLRFSTSFARRFIDAQERRLRDVRAKAVLHNNRVGRKSVRKQTRLQCKCHGVSGSCSYRTCWLKTSPFRKASQWLKKRYENAILVSAKPDGTGLMHRGKRELRKIDLVYLEQSPNYCRLNPKKGIFGTAGRQCNATSAGSDGCYSLCCGRGSYIQRQLMKTKCDCKFQWCCHVSCKVCQSWENVNYCNPPT